MTASLPEVTIAPNQVFPGGPDEALFESAGWPHPVTYFVGRNGSGKSRTARAVSQRAGGRYLSTDRLAGLMTFQNMGWTSVPSPENNRGAPMGHTERGQARNFAQQAGTGIDDLYALREQPEVSLRVAAFLKRALGREIELRETSGFLDPFVRLGSVEYSLLRDEGHGLRELVILLTAAYREDWDLLVVDEPELHLHPSMTRLWLTELERVCRGSHRRAIVVTHEPSVLRPRRAEDLNAVRLFFPGRGSVVLGDCVPTAAKARVSSSLAQNPTLVSQLVFSPRPVLVEGITDLAALSVALGRTQPPEVVAQTDLIECGGSGGVALWFEIARTAGLDVRAVGDLDSCLAPEVQRVMDGDALVVEAYRTQLLADPAKTSTVVRPLLDRMQQLDVPTDPKSRARWLAHDVEADSVWEMRRGRLLSIWRDAGFWLHEQGTLEDVLGIEDKGVEHARSAAAGAGTIDQVAAWCAYELDTSGDVETLLGVAVERIANTITVALRTRPTAEFSSPIGPSAETDARIVQVEALAPGKHRLTVIKPDAFAGHYLEFDRETPAARMNLTAPEPSPDATPESEGTE